MEVVQDVESYLFETQLQARSDIAFTIRQRSAFGARWSKESREFIGEHTADHGRALVPRHLDSFRMMAKVVEVQTELPVFFRANNLANLVNKARLSIRRESHHFSFVAVMWKTEKLRHRG